MDTAYSKNKYDQSVKIKVSKFQLENDKLLQHIRIRNSLSFKRDLKHDVTNRVPGVGDRLGAANVLRAD